MDDEAVGRFMVDKFYQVPPGPSSEYIPRMLEIVEKEQPDLLFPESSLEVYSLALNKKRFEDLGTPVLVSDPEPIALSTNKYQMYEVLRKETGITLPSYYSAESLDKFIDVIHKLGYPENPVVFKPHIGKGSRGVRIVDPKADRKRLLMEEKPISKFISLEEFKIIFEHVEDFPKFLVMDYLEGMERCCDTIAMQGRELLTTVKTVEEARWGVIVRGELVKRPNLIEQTCEILKAIPLSFCVNLQFINDKLIEINPRVSSFIYQLNMNAPYLSVKLLLGEISEDEIKKYVQQIDYGRRMVRYMDQLFHKDGEKLL
jgi:carbamoyl-phosphate synthase large subunit